VESVANAEGVPIKYSWWRSQLALDDRLPTTNLMAGGWDLLRREISTVAFMIK